MSCTDCTIPYTLPSMMCRDQLIYIYIYIFMNMEQFLNVDVLNPVMIQVEEVAP